MEDFYQIITLTLDDGSRVHYTGKVQIDPSKPSKVISVEVSHPYPLPEGSKWGEDVVHLATEKKDT